MCFSVLSDTGKVPAKELRALLQWRKTEVSSNPLREWLSDSSWGAVEYIASDTDVFTTLPAEMEEASARWKEWYTTQHPESERLPQAWKDCTAFQKLILLRALRPDRLVPALRSFIAETLGNQYVATAPLHLKQVYDELEASTPLLFLLSPGIDPLKEVSLLGAQLDVTEANGRLSVVSLGQGQEQAANEALDLACFAGNWVFLQNIHFGGDWLSTLDWKLQDLHSPATQKGLRIFLSASAPVPGVKSSIPFGILQNSVKVTTEPPTDMKTNMLRALGTFTPSHLESNMQQNEFKTTVFALCFFHAQVVGRTRYGALGWSGSYNFNLGDLRVSADVVFAYLERNAGVTPWEDMSYLIGDIMYGGHVTDTWDQRVLRTYLGKLFNDGLFEELEVAPYFNVPQTGSHESYWTHIMEHLPAQSPGMFGLAPNAEKLSLTKAADSLFGKLLVAMDVPQEDDSDAAAGFGQVSGIVADLSERTPELCVVAEVMERISDGSKSEDPFMSVLVQELKAMNRLIVEVKTSLTSLSQALNGEATMTEAAQGLMSALNTNQVPATWSNVASPSCKQLAEWFEDLLSRYCQLDEWAASLTLPCTIWLAGLFNPKAFLAAIVQTTARKLSAAMDDMIIVTDVTRKQKDDVETGPRDGAYLRGLFLEGAAFDTVAGVLCRSSDVPFSAELYPALALLHVRAVLAGSNSSKEKSFYRCPVYRTPQRGNTYVFTATLKTPGDVDKAEWVMAGAACVMEC